VYNTVLAWPTIVVPDDEPLETLGAAMIAMTSRAGKDDPRLRSAPDISGTFGFYVGALLGGCAPRITMITPPPTAWASADRLAGWLPPTFNRRLTFVDANGTAWSRVERYFEPIFESCLEYDLQDARDLAIDLYEVVLGAQLGLEIHIVPSATVEMVDGFLNETHIRGEARARLVVLRSLFAAATETVPHAGLEAVPGRERFLAETIDDILDDAEFLQASALRRHFSMSSNKRALSRNVRRLLSAVTRKKAWARSLMMGVQSLIVMACAKVGASQAATELVQTILDSAQSSSVVISPEPPLPEPSMVIRAVRAAKHEDEWYLRVRGLGQLPGA